MVASARTFIQRQPLRAIALLVAGWIALAILNSVVAIGLLRLRSPTVFPIWTFEEGGPHMAGLPWSVAFLALAFWARDRVGRFGAVQVLLLGFGLVLLGNLSHGGVDAGIRRPLYGTGVQLWHDATKIVDGAAWLRSFNDRQTELLVHARTHPPFAVLLHYLLGRVFRSNLTAVGLTFAFISSLTVVVLWKMLALLSVSSERRGLLVLLFPLIPAVNIYSAVSLDGVILFTASLALWGMLMILQRPDRSVAGMALIVVGVLATNLLTFGGLFLLGVLVVLIGWCFATGRRGAPLALSVGASAVASLAVLLVLRRGFDYHHLRAFLVANRVENPRGFSGYADPAQYVVSRIEDVGEIAFFLSFGMLAVLRRTVEGQARSPAERSARLLAGTAVGVLLAMFGTGAYRTGETARACLFVYPYLLLLYARLDDQAIKDLIPWAAVQTAVMQQLGGFFW
jgi:hypothetical protein